MPRNSRTFLCCLLAFLLFSTTVCMEKARGEGEGTPQIIEFLISTVARSHLTFIRNGENHMSDEAAAHMKRKYDFLRSKIKSPEDFISLCASKSTLSGKPYLVETEHGKIPVEKWLSEKPAEHMKSQKHQ